MNGSRPLEDFEVKLMIQNLSGKRNIALWIFGLKAGYRISELLSLKVENVVQYNKIKDSVTVTRANMKGKHRSRSVVLHEEIKKALVDMGVLTMEPSKKLFPISRVQAHRIIKKAVIKSKLEGKISSHTMRKTFCKKIYHALKKDLVATQKAMGHASVGSTISYLSFEQSEIDDAIKGV